MDSKIEHTTLVQNRRMLIVALVVIVLDQLTKQAVMKYLGYAQEKEIINGFFKFVHWHNTGAAWSFFTGYNDLLAVISIAALLVLFLSRHHFDAHTAPGQIALGLMFGGIVGNLVDRVHVKHVIDFIYFYVNRRGGGEVGFPAFNVADAAICTGVGLLFLRSWQKDQTRTQTADELANPETPSFRQ